MIVMVLILEDVDVFIVNLKGNVNVVNIFVLNSVINNDVVILMVFMDISNVSVEINIKIESIKDV